MHIGFQLLHTDALALQLAHVFCTVAKAFNHRNFPAVVNKSVFLETLLEYGLENLDAIGTRIAEEHASEQGNS